MDTGGRKWGRPYLTRAFFDLLGDDHGRPGAAGDGRGRRPPGRRRAQPHRRDALYGRYWGCLESHAFLHFELCYYQAIDYAIAHGLRARRGRRPGRAQARSAATCRCRPTRPHWIADRGFRRAVADFLERERRRRRAGDRGADGVLAVPEGERVAASPPNGGREGESPSLPLSSNLKDLLGLAPPSPYDGGGWPTADCRRPPAASARASWGTRP